MLCKEVYFQANSSRKEALAPHTPANRYSENIMIYKVISYCFNIFTFPACCQCLMIKCKSKGKKGKVVPVHAIEAYRESEM